MTQISTRGSGKIWRAENEFSAKILESDFSAKNQGGGRSESSQKIRLGGIFAENSPPDAACLKKSANPFEAIRSEP